MTVVDWDRLAAAYRSGRARVDQGRDLFAEEIDRLVSRYLDRHDQAMFAVVTGACERGLAAARAGSLATAKGHLRRASDAFDSPSVSPACRALGRSQHLAVLAYLRYRCGDPSGAEAALHEAIALDAGLCATGYRVLEVHRVQLGHNLARIRARTGDGAGAVASLADLLAYLRRVGPWPLDDGDATPDALADTPPALLQAMDRQLAGELALLVARHDDGLGAGDLVTFVLASLDERLGPLGESPCDTPTDLWRTLLAAQRDADGYAAGEATARLLGRGPQAAGLLWYLVALDVAAAARLMTDDPAAQRVAAGIEQDLLAQARLPQSVATAHRATRAGYRS